MKNIIISMIASLMLFASCEDVEPDSFAVDDVQIELIHNWEGGCMHYEVKIDNPKNLKLDRVGLRLRYHDKAPNDYYNDELKDIELTAEDGKYVYEAKDFPYAFAGDKIYAYAYVSVGGLELGSGEAVQVVPGSPDLEVTSAKFVFDDPSLTSTNRGTIYISGRFSPRHLAHKQGTFITLPDDNTEYDCYSDRLEIRGCYAEAYGKTSIVLRQYNKDYTVDVDVPGELSIDKVDRYSISVRDYLTLKVSGLREDCTYEVSGMTIENIARGSITCKPHDTGRQKVRLIEKHGTFSMSAFSKEWVDVHN